MIARRTLFADWSLGASTIFVSLQVAGITVVGARKPRPSSLGNKEKVNE